MASRRPQGQRFHPRMIPAYWSRLQASAFGPLDAGQLSALRSKISAVRNAGLGVALRINLQYPSGFVTGGSAPVPQFRAQDGTLWSATGSSGDNAGDPLAHRGRRDLHPRSLLERLAMLFERQVGLVPELETGSHPSSMAPFSGRGAGYGARLQVPALPSELEPALDRRQREISRILASSLRSIPRSTACNTLSLKPFESTFVPGSFHEEDQPLHNPLSGPLPLADQRLFLSPLRTASSAFRLYHFSRASR